MTTRRSMLKGFAATASLLAAGLEAGLTRGTQAAERDPQAGVDKPGRVSVTKLLEQPLPDMEDRVVLAVLVELKPGVEEPAHHHLGPAFVYIVDGAVSVQVGSSLPKIYNAGEMYYEPPHAVHRENTLGQDKPCRFLALQILRRGAAELVPEGSQS
jgi:quercetin dioxygenase-like cupin family protein